MMLKHKIGDKLVIVNNVGGHGFPNGTTVVVEELYENENPPNYLAHKLHDEKEYWYVYDNEVKPLELAIREEKVKKAQKTTFPSTLLCDFYKVSHKAQYPEGTEMIYSTWTPRASKYIKGVNEVVAFGIQGFVKEYLIDYFNEHFFARNKEEVVAEYERYLKFALGDNNPDSSHIAELHDLGYLPIAVNAIKEGVKVPIRVPMIEVYNTDNRFFWLTNYLETLMSAEIWQPMTTATIAYQYRKLLDEYAMKTVGNTDAVGFQAHDFSLRGMAGLHAGAKSGAGHLLSFEGTDTIPAIAYLEKYYNANIEEELVGASINATEHSVMCANTVIDGDSDRDEYEAFKRLITEVYPDGLMSIVSDTYDFWKVVSETLPKLKEDIMNRDGKVVIRPDSGDPVKILCGDKDATDPYVKAGLVECLWNIFGGTETEKGYKLLDPHIGAIYGDSITLERAEEIVKQLEQKGFASINVVLGVGSYSYQYTTRDTFGFAMKATYAVINGEEKMLFKDPKTDDGTKRSQRGIVFVHEDDNGKIVYKDGLNMDEFDSYSKKHVDLLETVFKDGELVKDLSLGEIRRTLRG